MSTHENRLKRIDFLELSDSERILFINAAREALRQSIEKAKFWRTLIESDEVTDNSEPIIF